MFEREHGRRGGVVREIIGEQVVDKSTVTRICQESREALPRVV
ncbi:MAG: hypothetical protein ACRDPC_13070 [Solirubrobacteraceae bacterium]